MYNYYKLLGIPTTANIKQIKTAYKTIAKKYHPDRNRTLPENERLKKQNLLAIITNGYEILTKPTKKEKYDLKLNFGIKKTKVQRQKKSRRHQTYHERRAAAQEYLKRKEAFDNKKFIQNFNKKTQYLSYHKIQILTVLVILFGFKYVILSFPMNNAEGSYDSLKFIAGLIILFLGLVNFVNTIYQKKKYEGLIQKRFVNFNKLPTRILISGFILAPFIIAYSISFRISFMQKNGKAAYTPNFEIERGYQFVSFKINNKNYLINYSDLAADILIAAHEDRRTYLEDRINNRQKYVVQYCIADPRIMTLVKIE